MRNVCALLWALVLIVFASCTPLGRGMSLLALAPEVDATVGATARVEFYALLGVASAPYTFTTSGPGVSNGLHWEWTPEGGDIGEHTLTISAFLGASLVESKSTTVRVAPNPGVEGRILLVGDSLTALSRYPNALASLLAAHPRADWSLVGSVMGTMPNVRFEAISGYTWVLFVNQGPFAPTGTLDVPGYIATTLGGIAPDRIVFGLGTNDISPAVDPNPPYGPINVEAVITTMIQYADLLIAAWRSAAPNAVIGVELIPPPNPDPLAWPATFPLATYRTIHHRAIERMIEHWSGSDDVTLIATNTSIPALGFADNVHPSVFGAADQAQMVYGWLASEGGEDVMSGEAIAPRIYAGPGIDITPEGEISAPAAVVVTSFQFVSVPTATTTGPGPVVFMTVPVTVTTAGDILVDFSASIEVEVVVSSAGFQGAAFAFLWDGAPIPPVPPSIVSQNAFMEFDPSTDGTPPNGFGPDSFSNQIRLRDVIVGASVGLHTLQVAFEGFAAESKVDVFDGSGALTVQSAPT